MVVAGEKLSPVDGHGERRLSVGPVARVGSSAGERFSYQCREEIISKQEIEK
jgi:hypothetical protein